MKKIQLTYEDVEALQHILKNYMYDYQEHMSKQHYDKLQTLSLKLIAMRAQLEYVKQRESE